MDLGYRTRRQLHVRLFVREICFQKSPLTLFATTSGAGSANNCSVSDKLNRTDSKCPATSLSLMLMKPRPLLESTLQSEHSSRKGDKSQDQCRQLLLLGGANYIMHSCDMCFGAMSARSRMTPRNTLLRNDQNSFVSLCIYKRTKLLQ